MSVKIKKISKNRKQTKLAMQESGFSLIELMVGLMIGLLVSLVIMNVFSVFEGQKRTTMGSADAQTNGNIALFNMTRNLQMAGYGMPILETKDSPWRCATATDARPATSVALSLSQFSPIVITDGGVGNSDTITVRFGTTEFAGFPAKVVGINAADTKQLTVDLNMGCKQNDIAIQAEGEPTSTCVFKKVSAMNAADVTHVPLNNANDLKPNGNLYCLGEWITHSYSISANNELLDGTTPIASDIVHLQAQYGISSAASNNNITQWVDPTGATWGAGNLTPANRNRIKAIRIVVIARNGLKEKDPVTGACTTALGSVANVGPCAWEDTVSSPAPKVDLSNLGADWNQYRYRTYETIVPLRNIAWSRVNY